MGFVRSRCFKLSLRAMPKLPMKYRSPSPPWPVPKRGKARNHGKRPSSSMAVSQKKNFKAMPYVRGPKVQNKFGKERNHYGVSIERLASMQPRQLIHKLTKDGILPAWNGSTCLHCAEGRLGKLRYFKERKHWAHRCSRKGCQKLTQSHSFHPIFFGGSGSSVTSLGQQAAILCCAVAGVPVTATPLIPDMDDKAVFRIYEGLEKGCAQHICQKQKHIKYGGDDAGWDVEADEVDLAKNIVVILHTDGARAYKMNIRGIAHYNVVHKKKKILQNGFEKVVLNKEPQAEDAAGFGYEQVQLHLMLRQQQREQEEMRQVIEEQRRKIAELKMQQERLQQAQLAMQPPMLPFGSAMNFPPSFAEAQPPFFRDQPTLLPNLAGGGSAGCPPPPEAQQFKSIPL
ncbi:unnamed protein product [Cladocopium goreaui]|uniref:Uncharacterized protein n=1 Tax=Cladocopium goreaui TaxID=2562237 RepID=A0A9P1GT29_9DINO|nr:unnamed protein product [Cladocopium goreaui]